MIVGVPREVKIGERRVALTPEGAASLRSSGARVLVERGAGRGSGFADEDYAAVGAAVVERSAVFGESDLVVKVKEPIGEEPELLRPGQTLFCYLHLAAEPRLARRLLNRGVIAIAYETVQLSDGSLPLLAPMSAITGRLAVQVGASLLQSDHGGRGVLLGGVMGVPPGTVVVLGAGTVGTHAVRVAVGLGARVVAIDRRASALEAIDRAFGGAVETRVSTPEVVAGAVAEADLVVGAVLVPGARAPMVVSREMVQSMVAGSAIVDVAVDQGGCVATTRPTSHETPTYVEEGVTHYAVPNIPALVPRTATLALTRTTLPYVQAIASLGTCDAVLSDPALAHGLTIWDDRVVCAPTAAALGLPATDPDLILSGRVSLKLTA